MSQGQHPASPRNPIKRECGLGDDMAYDHILRHHRTNSEPSSTHALPQGHSSGSNASRTYESFWREHEHNPITKKILLAKAASQALGSTTSKHAPHGSSPGFSGNGLQPPAQIIPERDRRSHYNPARQPPGLYQSISNQSNASTVSMVPNTPPQITMPDTQRTMEQDAVESLMFLSSPGHSQRRLSQSQSQSQSQLRELVEAAVEEPPLSQNSQERYNYSRNATTWPRSRRAFKQARTGLGALRMDSGVRFDDDLTDEDEHNLGAIEKGKRRETLLGDRMIPDSTRGVDGDIAIASAAS